MKVELLAAMTIAILTGCSASDDDALFRSIRAKDTQQVERILAKGDVALDPARLPNRVDKPLAFAAAYGNVDIVKMILARGADINGQVAYGDVPLIKAAEHGNRDIIVYLVEQGADVNKPNDFGVSPFIGFCSAESVELVELVELGLRHGGRINESFVDNVPPNKGEKNFTALQAAVAEGRTDVVKFLLAHGGDPNIKDSSGKTCLDLARERGQEDVVRMVKNAISSGGR
jgi:ankyrin repeat protein